MPTPSAYASLFLQHVRSKYDYLFHLFSSPTQLNADIELQKPSPLDIQIQKSSVPYITTSNRTLPILLFASLLFNLAAFAIFWSGSLPNNVLIPDAPKSLALTWTREAAEAAEVAALYDCSGNGDVFVDTLSFVDGEQEVLCECYECFKGAQCSERETNCTVTFTGGDLSLLHPYWKLYQRNQTAIVIPGYYRPSYKFVEDNSTFRFSPALEREIRKLHELVGNAVTRGRYILVGTGSIQLVNAAIWSYTREYGTYPADVVAGAPYYFSFRTQTEVFQTMRYQWAGDARNWSQSHPPNTSAIELVTVPNNPDGGPSDASLDGASFVYDHAYYWPHFTAITEAADHEVMLFSITKSLGFAGTRLGWAIVKNKTIYDYLLNYVSSNVIAVSHESQRRAFQLLRTVNNAYSNKSAVSGSLPPTQYAEEGLVFHYAYSQLQYRWVTISEVLEATDRFTLQHLVPQFCNFFKEEHHPSPAFAWIRCERPAEYTNCSAVFRTVNIIVRAGSLFESTDQYVRLSLMTRNASFVTMIGYLKDLVASS